VTEPRAAAHLAWALGAAGFFFAWFHRVTPSVMVDHLMADFAVGGTVLGTLSALYFWAYAGLQIPIGVFVDRWGPRRPFGAALLVAAIGAGLFAMAGGIELAYLGRLLIGGGAAFAWVALLKITATHFPQEKVAMLSGAGMFIGLCGGLGGQIAAGALVDTIGWRATMWGTAAAGTALALLVWTIMRDPAGDTDGHARMGDLLADLGAALVRPAVWLVSLGGAVGAAPLFIFGALWGVPYLMQVEDASRPEAATATSMMLFGWGVGAFLVGWISDRIGRRRLPLIIGMATAALLIVVVLYVPGLPLPVIGVLLFICGACSGTVVLTYIIAGELVAGRAQGGAFGFANMLIILSGAVFQPVAGWLLDRQWDGAMVGGARLYKPDVYGDAFLLLPAAFLLAMVLIWRVRETGPAGTDRP